MLYIIIIIIIIIIMIIIIIGWAKDYSRLRENAEGHFIGDAQYCKNFQSSNMMMLISRLID